MKTVNVVIEGTSALLINRFKDNSEIPCTTIKGKKDYGTPREQAESTVYKDENTLLLCPFLSKYFGWRFF